MNRRVFFYIAIGCLVVALISLFIPVISYRMDEGTDGAQSFSYSVFGLIGNSEEFETNVLWDYTGPVVWNITGGIAVLLTAIFCVSYIISVIGLVTLRAQYPNTWQFVMTIVGLIGVMIPSVVLIVGVMGYGKYFRGSLSFGAAPIVTIIAMILCILAVSRRKKNVKEELRMKMELEQTGIIKRAGDLE